MTAQTTVELPAGPVTVRALGPDEAVAGGPVTVRCEIEYAGTGELGLLIAGDSATGRPADVRFSATLDGTDVAFEDPAAGVASIGGPAATVSIAPGRPFAHDLLVNQYLTLERLVDAVPAGERRQLTLRLERTLRPTGERAAVTAELELEIDVRGDPAERARVTDELARAVADDERPGSALRDQPLTALLALRTPEAARRVASLLEHPDGGVRHRIGAGR